MNKHIPTETLDALTVRLVREVIDEIIVEERLEALAREHSLNYTIELTYYELAYARNTHKTIEHFEANGRAPTFFITKIDGTACPPVAIGPSEDEARARILAAGAQEALYRADAARCGCNSPCHPYGCR